MFLAAPRSARDVRAASKRAIGGLCHVLVERASASTKQQQQRSALMDESTEYFHYQQPLASFWASSTAMFIYALTILTVATGWFWILHGISLLIVDQILQVVVKWFIFTLNDRELQFARHYILSWLSLIIREGEQIVNSESAAKFVTAQSILQSAPTGVSYARWIIRYKMRAAHLEFLREGVGKERLTVKKRRLAMVAAKKAKAKAKKAKTKVKGCMGRQEREFAVNVGNTLEA